MTFIPDRCYSLLISGGKDQWVPLGALELDSKLRRLRNLPFVIIINKLLLFILPYPLLDNIQVMVIVWRLRGNIRRTAPCRVVWHNVHSQQHTRVSSSYRSSRLGLLHWDLYTMHRSGCLELYYCNMVECSWWDSSLILETNWFLSVLWHCWFGHMTCKNCPRYDLYCVWCGLVGR